MQWLYYDSANKKKSITADVPISAHVSSEFCYVRVYYSTKNVKLTQDLRGYYMYMYNVGVRF